MRMNLEKLRQIADMDDDSFRALIRTVILTAGGTSEQAEAAAAQAPLLKEKLRTADEKEIGHLIELVGRGKVEKIWQNMEKPQ